MESFVRDRVLYQNTIEPFRDADIDKYDVLYLPEIGPLLQKLQDIVVQC